MNIIEAVQQLMAKGGRIRRKDWKAGMWVTAENGPKYYFVYYEGSAPRGRGTPTPEDMLAIDWEWVSSGTGGSR